MFAKMKQKKFEDSSKTRKESDKPSDGNEGHGPSPPEVTRPEATPLHNKATPPHHEATPSHNEATPPHHEATPLRHEATQLHHEVTSSQSDTTTSQPGTAPSRSQPTPASFSVPSVSNISSEATNSITPSDVPPEVVQEGSPANSGLGSSASDTHVTDESKPSTQESGPVETTVPTSDEIGGDGSPQSVMPSQEPEEPSSPGMGLQLLDSTRQLGSRMFGMLRNRLPMGEPTTPTGHTHQPHPLPTPGSEQEEEPATPTTKSLSKEVESTPAAEDDQEILKLMQSLSQEELVVVATKERKTRVRYRKKCLQLKEALDTSYREKDKLQSTLQITQDKSMTRIKELKEAADLDRKAKSQREEFFAEQLEEKNQKIEVLQTQVNLLKEQMFSSPQSSGEVKQSPKGEASAVGGEGEVAALKDKVSKLEDLLSRYKEGLRRAKEKVAQLAGEKEQLRAQLVAKEGQCVQTEGEGTDSATASEENTRKELEEAHSSLQHLQQALAEREQKLDTSTEESLRYKQEVAQMRVEKDNVVNLLSLEMEELQRKLKVEEEVVAGLQEKLGEATKEVDLLLSEKEKAEKTAEELATKLTSLGQELQESQSLSAKSSHEVESLRDELEGLKQQRAAESSEVQQTIHSLQEEVRSLHQELEDRKNKTEASVTNLERELNRTKAELEEKEDMLAATAVSKETHRQSALDQEEEIASLKSKLHQMATYVEEERASKQSLESQLESLNAALENIKQDGHKAHQETEEKLRIKESELSEVTAKYSTAVEREDSVRAERDVALRGWEEARLQWETQLSALKETQQQEISGLAHQYDEERSMLMQQSASNTAQVEQEWEEQLSTLKKKHDAELAALQAEHSQRLAEVKTAVEAEAEENRAHAESNLVAKHQEELAKLKEELTRAEQEKKESAMNASRLQNQLSSLLQESAGQSDVHTALQEQTHHLHEKLQSLEQDRASAKEECATQKAELVTLSQELVAVRREKEDTDQYCAQLESKMAAIHVDHEEKLQLLQNEHSTQLEQAKQDFEQVRTDELTTLKKSQEEDVRKMLARHTEEMANVRESASAQMEAVVEDHRALVARMEEEHASQLTAEKERLQEIQALLEKKKIVVASLSEEKLAVEEERSTALADLQKAREDFEAVKHQVMELQEAKDESARTAADNLQAVLEKNDNEKAQIIASFEEKLTGVTQEKESIISELATTTSLSESLQEQVADLQRKLAAGASELAAVRESNAAELEHTRSQFEAERQHLMDSLKSNLEQKEAEVLAHSEAERGEEVDQMRENYQQENQRIRQQHAEALEKLKKQAKARIESLKKTQAEELAQLKEASRLQSEKDEREMSSLHAKISACEERLKETEGRLTDAMREQKAASARATTLEEELAQCKEIHRSVAAEMEREKAGDIKRAVETAKAETAAELGKKIESEHTALTEQLTAKDSEIARLTQEVLEARKVLGDTAKEKEAAESSLQQSLEADRRKSQEMEKMVQELTSEMTTLKDSLNGRDSTIDKLQKELTVKEEAVERLASELKNTQSEVQASHKEIKKKAESKLAGMKKQFALQLEDSEKRIGEEREAWKSKEQELSNTIAELQETSQGLQVRVTEMEESSEVVRQEKAALEASLQAANSREKEMEESLASTQDELEGVKGTCEQQLLELSAREKQLSTVGDESLQLRSALSALEENTKQCNAESATRAEELHASLEQSLSERDLLQKAVEELKEKLREAEVAAKDVKAEWKERYNNAEEDWKQRMMEVTEKVEERRQELLAQHKTELKGVEDQLRAAEAERSAVQQNANDLQLTLTEAESRCEQLQGELVAAKEGHMKEMEYLQQQVEEEAAVKYEERLAQLSGQLQAIDVGKESEELQAQLDHLAQQHEEEVKRLKGEVQLAKSEAEMLHSAEKERRQEIEALGAELVLFQDRVSNAEGMNRKMEQVVGDYKKLLRTADEERSRVEEEKKSAEDQALTWMGQVESLRDKNVNYEAKIQELGELAEELREKLSKACDPQGTHNQTPLRGAQHVPIETPSKHLTLDAEPHGEEFEYFRNVLYHYMMGKGDKHMARALAALARFSPEQSANITKKHA